MKKWKKYFYNNLIDNKSKIKKLLSIDESISYDYLLELVEKDIDLDIIKYNTILLEGSSIILINIIDKLFETNKNIIICTLDNYSLNTYIIKVYNDFVSLNNINTKLDIKIDKHFNIEGNNVLSIGSKAFNNEMKSIYKDIKSIEIDMGV